MAESTPKPLIKKPSGGTKPPKGGRAVPQRGRPSGGTRAPGSSAPKKSSAPARGADKTGRPGGTFTSSERMSGSQKSYKSPFKPPATRKTTEPTRFKKPSTSVTEYKKPGTSVTEYKKPSTSVTEYKEPKKSVGARSSGGGRSLAAGLGGLGAATLGFYLGDTFSSKTGNQANYGEREELAKGLGPLMKGNKHYDKPIGPKKPDSSGPKRGPGRGPAHYAKNAPERTAQYNPGDYAKYRQEKAPAASVSSVAAPKKAEDKSTQAGKAKPSSATGTPAKPSSVTGTPAKPMTNFERMKARQYEKEGYGGRSMTSAGAKSQVEKERGYKLPTGRLTFGAKAASKPASGASKAVKQGSTNTFASKMQGRNVPGSPTYSPAKAKSGLKFSDIFNRKK